MSETKQRRKALRSLLLAARASTQGELVDLLADRGFHTTQSTVSRDLRLLGAQRRVREDGGLAYFLPRARSIEFPSHMVRAVEDNGTMIVVHTLVGRAPVVGIELDALRHPQIMGTVAGDDTVLVVPKDPKRIRALVEALCELAEL
jgi:transcriptional regulator of arginine metabolism